MPNNQLNIQEEEGKDSGCLMDWLGDYQLTGSKPEKTKEHMKKNKKRDTVNTRFKRKISITGEVSEGKPVKQQI